MSGHPSAHHANCQNCGAPLSGPYCSACGQHDVDYHRSIWPMVEDAIEGFFHVDGKAVKSVRYLVTRPGYLTQEFVAGRRASYANPLRLYIFISFLFFAAQALLGHRITREEQAALAKEARASTQQAAKDLKDLPELRKRIEAATTTGAGVTPTPTAARSPFRVSVGSAVPVDGEAIKIDIDDLNNRSLISRYLREHLGPDGTLDIRAVQAEVTHLLPAMIFLCLPLLAVVLSVVFEGARRVYIEHLVFALHVQTFLFLSGLIAKIVTKLVGLLSKGGAGLVETAFLIVTVWLVYRALRRFYGQGRWRTALKLALAAGSYGLILIVGMIVVSVGSVLVVLHEA